MPWLLFPWIVILLTLTAIVAGKMIPTWLRLLITVSSLTALTFILMPVVGSPIAPHFTADPGSFEDASEKLFVAAWWLVLARVAIIGGRLVLGINRQHHAARLALDLVAGAVYLGAMIAVTDLVFGISVPGLIATSGIIAIVLGLALQSTLGDLFSGIAIGIERPFGVGDLVSIEGTAEGRVVETNWRSTRVATATNDIATIPNSVVAKSRILNRSSPTETRTETVKVVLDAAVSPKQGVALLNAASLNASLLSRDAPPKVVCVALSGEGTTYEISFSTPITILGSARSDLLQQVSRYARYAGVALATQNATPITPVSAPDLKQLLHETHVLEALTDAECATLTSRINVHRGETGDRIFSQGGNLASLFIIASGTFEVTRDDGFGSRRLGTIGPGDYFGELALLTGEPNAATVTALTPFVAYEVGKAMISPLLHENPALLHAFEEGACKAQALLDRTIAAQAGLNTSSTNLLDRIRSFFNVHDRASSHRRTLKRDAGLVSASAEPKSSPQTE